MEETLLELHVVNRINLDKSQKMHYNWPQIFMQQSEPSLGNKNYFVTSPNSGG